NASPALIGVIATAGTIALLGFATGIVMAASGRRVRDAAWAAAALALGLATMAARSSPGWHVVLSALTLATALRNAICLVGRDRWPAIVAAGAWVLAVIAARLLFR